MEEVSFGRRGFRDHVRRFLVVAGAVAMLAVTAPEAWGADQIWSPIGLQSPNDTSYSRDPSLAQLNGTPYVAWSQLQGNGPKHLPREASFSGSPGDVRPWTQIAPTYPAASPGVDSLTPRLAIIAGGTYAGTYLATLEQGASGGVALRVFKNVPSNQWNLLGAAPLNIDTTQDASSPTLVAVGGVPYVAWTEHTAAGKHVGHVKRLTPGLTWSEVGSGATPINQSASGDLTSISLSDVGGVPYVAFSEDGVARVKSYDSGTNTWVAAGSTANIPTNIGYISFAFPYLAGLVGAPGQVVVARYNNGTWDLVGGSLNADPNRDAALPKVALVSGVPYVSWSETNGTLRILRVSRLNDAGTGFQAVGGGLNRNFWNALASDITDVNGTPVVAWDESDPNSTATQVFVDAQVPMATSPPHLSGTPKPGSQLTCTHGAWTENPSSFTTVWERGMRGAPPDDPSWHAIMSATGSTYNVQPADVPSSVRCRVQATAPFASAEAVSNSSRVDNDVPGNTSPPVVQGTPVLGQTLSCNHGNWTNNPDFSYQWLRDGQPILSETGQTYVPRERFGVSDDEAQISCQVSAANDVGSGTPVTSAGVKAVAGPPVNMIRPYVAQLGAGQGAVNPLNPIQCSVGTWSDDYHQYTYAWTRNGGPIAGATGSSYKPTSEDYGRQIACEVTSTNPAGGATATSNLILVKLPTGTEDSQIYMDGGGNQADPTNLMAISNDYLAAIRSFTLDKLNQGVAQATAECQKNAAQYPSAPRQRSVADPVSDATRCEILLHDRRHVSVNVDSGVRYQNGVGCEIDPATGELLPGKHPKPCHNVNVTLGCATTPASETSTRPLCPSLGIEVPSIDPLHPPTENAELMKALAPVTPKAILWDLNGDGKTDAVCPASAPVLRTIFGSGNWHPRAVILDQNDLPAHFGRLDFSLRTNFHGGFLRADQVKVCATSFDPPPTPQLPCITAGTIGRVQFSNANLCPISARQINPTDFTNLLSPDLQQFLIDAANQGLISQGKVTHGLLQRGPPLEHTVFVPWGPTSPVHAAHDSAALDSGSRSLGPDASVVALGDSARSVLASNVAALTSHASPILTDNLRAEFRSTALQNLALTDNFRPDNAGFAFDQIYESVGNSATLNGMTLSPLAGTAMLLVPTDIKNALPDAHSMQLVGQNVASQLGLPGDPRALVLATAGQLKQDLQDSARAEGEQILRDTNVTSMIDDARKQGGALADELQGKLDNAIKPFKLLGDSKIVAEPDGTATIIADVGIPSLNGVGGAPISAKATVHADSLGHLALRGLHIHAEWAGFGDVALRDVDVTYDSNLGVDIKGKIDLHVPLEATIDIKEFKLGPDGTPQRIAVDYLAGPTGGIPVGPFDLNITAIGFDLNLEHAINTFFAHVVFGIGAIGDGCPAAGIDAGLKIKLSDPFALDGSGDVEIACLKLANINAHVDGSGLFSVDGSAHIDVGPLYFTAGLGAAFRYPDWQVYGGGSGGVRHVLQGHIEAVLSNLGLAGCGSVDVDVPVLSDAVSFVSGGSGTIHVAGGASVDFINGRPPLDEFELIKNLSLFVGCDIGGYYSLPHPPLARDAAAGTSGFVIAPGTGPSLLSIEGLGGAPRVKLRSPSGQVLDFTGATGPTGQRLSRYVWGTVIPQEDRTVAILGKIEPGRWTVESAPGSATVLRVRRAPILPPVGVKGKVSGHGHQRLLTYRILGQPGQTVRFLEQSKGESKLLATVRHGGRGQLRFTPAESFSPHRTLIAEVIENRLPRAVLTLQHYNVPVAAVGAPRHVRIIRHGRSALITWGAAPLGARYRVQATYGSGLSVLLIPRRGALRVTAGGLHPGEGMVVSVQAISALGRLGPVARGRLAGTLHLGATVHYDRPAKQPKPRRPRRHHR